MKTTIESSISIGFNIFAATLGIVFVVLLLTSFVFLVVFSETLSDIVESQSREINKQIVMNYERYINSVIETANYIQFSSFDLDVDRDGAALAELYRANADIKQDVVAIFLFDASGTLLVGPALDSGSSAMIASRRWFKLARDIKEIYHFTTERASSIAANRDDDVISVSRSVEYVINGRAADGVLLLELNNNSITELARKTNLGEGGHLLILDERGTLLYSSETPATVRSDKSLALAAGMHLGGLRASIERVDMYLYVNTLIQTRWRIVTVSNVDEIHGAIRRLAGILVGIFVIAVIISALVAGVISLRVSRPVTQLKEVMLRIEQGDFSVPVEVSGQKEIVLLAHSFNSMVLKVRELMARLVDEQREKRKTELRALQNQINPHFLYNTLDSIVWLAENNRTKDVITTVVALARLFRISISKGATFIPVQDEISHIKNYLTIQSIRYLDRFTWELDVQPEMLEMNVMKLMLQPLVENAIQHGLGDEEGHIKITGRIEDNFLVFRVRNSGYGIPDSKIVEMYETMRGG
ncbi:MAG: histidine kinase, partial [Spirochaetales bacterium]|nr:histidine kinase [Spirochaetales bacterium]